MINWFLNLFRKNKVCTFHPRACCSGSGAAIQEFLDYKESIEKATERKVRMLTEHNFFGFERIKYVIEEK